MAYSPYFVGPYKTGLEKDMDSYLIPEEAFQELENAYVWRGRVYKKGGTELLGIETNSIYAGRLGKRTISLAARGAGADVYNLALTANPLDLPLEPGSLIITDGTTTFTDNGTGNFVVTPVAGNGTVNAPTNYATSAINITFNVGNAGAAVTATFLVLVGNNSPVMGLREFDILNSIDPGLVAFDLKSAYQFNRTTSLFDQTRFYKGTNNLVNWTGTDTDFFYSTNYQGALFATNNIPGGHFYSITAIVTGATTQVTTSVANNFQVGDLVYINNATIAAPDNLNGKTGAVTIAGNPFTVAINSAASGAYTAPSGVAWSPTLSKAAGGDGIRWFDGFTAGAAPATGWVNFNPPLDNTAAPQILLGGLIVIPYKGYLVILNTVEGTSLATQRRFTNRARWSQAQFSVYYGAPYPVNYPVVFPNGQDPGNEWYSVPLNTGGFIDAPTTEDIISAEFIKDTLIVYFESSTWKLSYTGNPIDPFIWEKINTEIGATSTFSVVPFDRNILSIGPNGAYGCDSINIDRIDRIIPDEVFTFHTTTNASKRIHGIRNFYGESVQWTFTDNDQEVSSVFPTKTLYYNYLNNSFAVFKNTFTCFGHFTQNSDLTWAQANHPWNYYGRAWNSFVSHSGFPIVIAGNQQGFIFSLQNADGTAIASNDNSLVIQNITGAAPSVFTVPNHNLQPGDTIYIEDVGGAVGFNGNIYKVVLDASYTTNTFTVQDSIDNPISFPGYTFGGKISIIDSFSIQTKNLNPFFQQGKSIRMGYSDFYIDDIETSEVTVYLFLNDDVEDIQNAAEEHTMDLEDFSDHDNTKFWTRVFYNSQANFITLKITYDAAQLFTPAISMNTFVLHGSIFWMKPTGRLLNR